MAGQNTLQLTEQNFQQQVLDHDGTVLVDFFADWCQPCKVVGPVVDALADNYAGQVPVGKVNVDDNPALAAKYGIRSIPSLLVFRDGEVVNQLVGYQSKDKLAAAIEAARSQPTA
ncbi:MAG: thioredoxin [Phycisphaerales bacterium]|jgi:thioredoxin 1